MIQALSSAAGGGGGYGGDISSKISSGGTGKAAFGAINFGDNAKVGGTSTAEGTGGNSLLILAAVAVIAFLLFRR